MSAGELLRALRDHGVTLTLEEDGLHCEGPPGVVRPSLLADLKRHEAALIDRLLDETAATVFAEKVGELMVYWRPHTYEWSLSEYHRRRGVLVTCIFHLNAALRPTGDPLEAYGWTVSPQCVWRRAGRKEMRGRL
jgi:hypothetical protein